MIMGFMRKKLDNMRPSKLAFPVLLLVLISALVSCSINTDAQAIICNLPEYDDNTPIDWDTLIPEELKGITTVGLLKEALCKDLNPNKAIGWRKGVLSDYLCPVWVSERDQGDFRRRLKSRLAALDVLLNAGASPQYMSEFFLVTEEEYALHIKHGLNAREPIQSPKGYREYPLTNRMAFLSPAIVKWLLDNGADPNQISIQNHYGRLPKVTPLSIVKYSPEITLGIYEWNLIGLTLKRLRTKKYVDIITKLLIEHGAKDFSKP